MDEALAPHPAMGEAATAVHVLAARDCAAALAALGPLAEALASAHGFAAKPGQVLAVIGEDGAARRLLAGVGALEGPEAAMALRGLPVAAPPGLYAFAETPAGFDHALGATAFALGARVFDRYKAEPAKAAARLVVRDDALRGRLLSIARNCALARDMVDTPANDMGPAEIEAIARDVAAAHAAAVTVTVGDALLAQGYPALHAVGRAAEAARAPRMIEVGWRGPGAGEGAPHLALIGKGVTFDTGGLDLKPSAGMRNMKKDMGGAAHALALAAMVMDAALPLRLTLLLPVAENAIGAAAMRPGDVLATRKGLSVEIGNTDAEGRLILADALARAAELAPDLTLDLATLTGAARAALGPDVPPFFTDDETLAAEIADAALAVRDPLWRLPLWSPYAAALDSDVADLKNDADAWAQAGSIAAALFLKRFAPAAGSWAHVDIYAWNPRKRPGWPTGGEAQAIRALFHLLVRRYGATGEVSALDPRLTPARGGLAALSLEGVRPAARYAAPEPMQAAFAVAAVRREPGRGAEQLDQLLHGERFEVLERQDGWGFGQAARDGYVGWVRLEALAPAGPPPTHWVSALRTYGFGAASIKAAPVLRLSMNALVRVERMQESLAELAGGGFVAARHLRPLGDWADEPAAVAAQYLGAPYLWGGRDSLGIDCSGLVQQALYACGRACPRDSDQQQALGVARGPGAPARGDLVFWRGHVGMMLDGATLLHANAFHMAVTAEPLAEAVARIGEPLAYRRPTHG